MPDLILMDRLLTDQAILNSAYKRFLQEIEAQISFAENFFPSDRKNQEPPSSKEREKIVLDAHRIKGGAGFFGLVEIALIAGPIEDILKHSVDWSKNAGEVYSLIFDLKTRTQQLEQSLENQPK